MLYVCRVMTPQPVKFPLDLDIYGFCTQDFKNKINAYRDAFRAKEEVVMDAIKNKTVGTGGVYCRSMVMTPGDDITIPELNTWTLTTSDGKLNDVVDSGWYELTAVVGHMGRSADGGHYLAWVKSEKGVCDVMYSYL